MHEQPPANPAPEGEVLRPALTLRILLRHGIRLAFFRRPDQLLPFSPAWFSGLAGLAVLLSLAMQLLVVGRDGHFVWNALPAAFFFAPLLLLTACVLALLERRNARAGALSMSLLCLYLPIAVSEPCLQAAATVWPLELEDKWLWLLYYASSLLWLPLASAVAAIRILTLRPRSWPMAVMLPFVCLGLPLSSIDPQVWLWSFSVAGQDAQSQQYYNLLNSEDNFYRQPQLLEEALAALEPGRAGQVDVFFVGVAGYAPEAVFMREVTSVAQLFDERFDTRGRSLRLINHADTVAELPIASTTALQRAFARISELMDEDEDVLFLFLTSHGSREHKFSLDFGAMRFNDLDAATLRRLLDEAGIRNRIVLVSACYSGGFIEPLKDDNTLVITAAAADKTSFGCDNESEYTYFGRAYFDEALRDTYSFVQAYALARKSVTVRERQEGYTPSEPQISLGENLAPLLEAFERRMKLGLHAASLPSPSAASMPPSRAAPRAQ